MEFYLYKGLKKPLVLFGLKDKYIYQALACAAFGIICLAALPSLIGWIGFLIGAAIAGGGVSLLCTLKIRSYFQRKAEENKSLFILPLPVL